MLVEHQLKLAAVDWHACRAIVHHFVNKLPTLGRYSVNSQSTGYFLHIFYSRSIYWLTLNFQSGDSWSLYWSTCQPIIDRVVTAGRPNKKRCRPRLNWHVEWVSTDMSTEYRPSLDWQSIECRSILSTESRSTDVLNTHDLHNPRIGAYSFKPYSFVPHERGNILLGCAVDHRSPIFIRCLSWICCKRDL